MGGGSKYVSYTPLRYQKHKVFERGPSPQTNVMQDLEGLRLHLFAPLVLAPPWKRSSPWTPMKLQGAGGWRNSWKGGQEWAGRPLKWPRCITIQILFRFVVCTCLSNMDWNGWNTFQMVCPYLLKDHQIPSNTSKMENYMPEVSKEM